MSCNLFFFGGGGGQIFKSFPWFEPLLEVLKISDVLEELLTPNFIKGVSLHFVWYIFIKILSHIKIVLKYWRLSSNNHIRLSEFSFSCTSSIYSNLDFFLIFCENYNVYYIHIQHKYKIKVEILYLFIVYLNFVFVSYYKSLGYSDFYWNTYLML